MQVAGDHLLAGTGLTGNENADVLIRHLLHQLAYLLDFSAGSHKAPEELQTALLATLPGAGELIPIDLGPVERIDELGVIERPFHASNDATAGLVGQPLELRVTNNQKRYALNGITHSGDRLGGSCILAIHHRDRDI